MPSPAVSPTPSSPSTPTARSDTQTTRLYERRATTEGTSRRRRRRVFPTLRSAHSRDWIDTFGQAPGTSTGTTSNAARDRRRDPPTVAAAAAISTTGSGSVRAYSDIADRKERDGPSKRRTGDSTWRWTERTPASTSGTRRRDGLGRGDRCSAGRHRRPSRHRLGVYEYIRPDDRQSLEAAFERVSKPMNGSTPSSGPTSTGRRGAPDARSLEARRTGSASRRHRHGYHARKERERTLRANNDSLQVLLSLLRNGLSEAERRRVAKSVGQLDRRWLPEPYRGRSPRLRRHREHASRIRDSRRRLRIPTASECSTPETTMRLPMPPPRGDTRRTCTCKAASRAPPGPHHGRRRATRRSVGDEQARSESFSDSEEASETAREWVNHELDAATVGRTRTDENIVEAVDDGVYALDSEGYFESSQAMTDLTGYSEDELLGSYTGFIKNDGVVERAESIARRCYSRTATTRRRSNCRPAGVGRVVPCARPPDGYCTTTTSDSPGPQALFGISRSRNGVTRRCPRLLDTTRSLMQAQTPRKSPDGHRGDPVGPRVRPLAVRLYDEETDTLRPAAASDKPGPAGIQRRRGVPGEAFERGDPLVIDEFDRVDDDDSDVLSATMYLPMGDHGVVSVGAQQGHEFTESDVSVGKILASNAAAAFDRVERERSLLRYESVVENVRDMMYVLDDEGRFQWSPNRSRNGSATSGRRFWASTRALFSIRTRLMSLHVASVTSVSRAEPGRSSSKRRWKRHAARRARQSSRVGPTRPFRGPWSCWVEPNSKRASPSWKTNATVLVPVEYASRRRLETETVAMSRSSDQHRDFRRVGTVRTRPSTSLIRLVRLRRTNDELLQFDRWTGDTARDERRRRTGPALVGRAGYRPRRRDYEHPRRLGGHNRTERVEAACTAHRVRGTISGRPTVACRRRAGRANRRRESSLHSPQAPAKGRRDGVAERARTRQERSVRRDQSGTGPVEVSATITDIVSSHRDNSSTKEPPPADAGRRVTAPATSILSELVENSLEHGGDDPSVRVDVQVDRQTVSTRSLTTGRGFHSTNSMLEGDEPGTQLATEPDSACGWSTGWSKPTAARWSSVPFRTGGQSSR